MSAPINKAIQPLIHTLFLPQYTVRVHFANKLTQQSADNTAALRTLIARSTLSFDNDGAHSTCGKKRRRDEESGWQYFCLYHANGLMMIIFAIGVVCEIVEEVFSVLTYQNSDVTADKKQWAEHMALQTRITVATGSTEMGAQVLLLNTYTNSITHAFQLRLDPGDSEWTEEVVKVVKETT